MADLQIRPESSMSNHQPVSQAAYGRIPPTLMTKAQVAGGRGFTIGHSPFTTTDFTMVAPSAHPSGTNDMAHGTTMGYGILPLVRTARDFDMQNRGNLYSSWQVKYPGPFASVTGVTPAGSGNFTSAHHFKLPDAETLVFQDSGSLFHAHPPHRPEVRDWLARQGPPTNFQPIARVPTMGLPLPHWILQGYRPTLSQAMDSFPFISPLEHLAPHKNGVLKFTNIPYNATKNELIAAIGGKAQIIAQPTGSPFFAVHVIMERNSGKTMDAYIEVSSPAEAKSIADSFDRRSQQGRQLRIGDRVVEIHSASQADLMRDLFPCAKNVKWHGHVPQITEETKMYYENVVALGFDGFVGSEEMVILAKFADTPARSPFAVKCPNRVYECMISTLHKYPWHSPRTTLLSDRKKIFDTTIACVRSLCQSLSRPNNHPNLTEVLLQELAVAALGCPGLSEMQKSRIVGAMHYEGFGYVANGAGMRVTLGGTGRTAHYWPLLILIKHPGVDDALLDVYIDILVEAMPDTTHYTLAAQSTMRPWSAGSSDTRTSGSSGRTQRFGSMAIDYNATDMGRLTLAEVAQVELDAIKNILFKMLDFGHRRTERSLTLD